MPKTLLSKGQSESWPKSILFLIMLIILGLIMIADDQAHTQHSHPFYFLPDIFKKLQRVKNRKIVES